MCNQLEKLITLTNDDLSLVSRRFGQRTDMTNDQLELLRILYNYDRLSQYDLTMKISREQSVVSRWVKKSIHRGCITSQQSHEDLRCRGLCLTTEARDLTKQINVTRCELIEAKYQCLTEGEIDNLSRLLNKLNSRHLYI